MRNGFISRLISLTVLSTTLIVLVFNRPTEFAETVNERQLRLLESEPDLSTNNNLLYYDLYKTRTNFSMDYPPLVTAIRKILVPPLDDEHTVNSFFMSPPTGESELILIADLLRSFGKNGFFVETGSSVSRGALNSLWLEKTLGWSGLIIDPDSSILQRISHSHPRTWKARLIVSTTFHPHMEAKGFITLGSELLELRQRTFKVDTMILNIPLYSILLAVNQTQVEVLRLSLGGRELDLLQTIPFERVVVVENLTYDKASWELVRFMMKKSYYHRKIVHPSGSRDALFAHRSLQKHWDKDWK